MKQATRDRIVWMTLAIIAGLAFGGAFIGVPMTWWRFALVLFGATSYAACVLHKKESGQ